MSTCSYSVFDVDGEAERERPAMFGVGVSGDRGEEGTNAKGGGSLGLISTSFAPN